MSDTRFSYHFRAMTPERTLIDGVLDGTSREEIAQTLRQRGYVPIRVETSSITTGLLHRDIQFPWSNRLSLRDCAALCQELGLLHDAGLSSETALSLFGAAQPRGSRLSLIATAATHGLRLGQPLSAALDATGTRFPPDFLPALRSAEQSAAVGAVLKDLAASYAEAIKFRATYMSALLYPAVLLIVAVAVLLLIAVMVAPNLVGLFETLGRPAPLTISVLSALGRFVGDSPLVIILALLVPVAGLSALSRVPKLRAAFGAALMALPVIGRAILWARIQRFAVTLRFQLRAHVSLPEATQIAFAASRLAPAESDGAATANSLRQGETLAKSLERVRLFPERVIQMIAIGERSAHLEHMLGAVEEDARRNYESRMARISGLLAPALILAIGVLIGGIVLSVFSALLEMNNFVR